jgi:hypothetical protein
MDGVGLKNSGNTVGIAVFESEFDMQETIVYSLKNLKQAITILDSIIDNEDSEIYITILPKENGPLLTMRALKETKMCVVVCPIVTGDPTP